ncbi:hypothetical protein ACFFVF_02500 [Flavobacterium jumunjinense]|uniref:Uncharacterized protein n=2 Tax=Flavobacterium jumunjinense TaxID=998845 RepID=A0ABV5GJ95_9FLAO|nr:MULTISPECIES: hypothetical protein [Flavobacterium]
MNKELIVQFINDNFSNNRSNLIQLLKKFNWESSVLKNIYCDLLDNIDKPFYSERGFSQEVKENLNQKTINNDRLGDIADFYTIIFNLNLKESDILDTTNLLKQDSEIHYCNIWISWFLPIYYIEVCYIKDIDSGKFTQEGPLKELDNLEHILIDKIHKTLKKWNYSLCDFDFLKDKVKEANTDCFEERETSIFDCVFSDLHYYNDKLNRYFRYHNIPDPSNKKYYFKITDYFNDDFKLIQSKKERYIGFHGTINT